MAPFFNVYLRQQGLSGAEIGVIASIPPLVALAANPFWGGVADRWQIHRLVMALCALVAGLISFTFGWLTGFWVLLLAIMLMIFFRTPVPALLNSAVMDMVSRTDTDYGRQRLFGSIGFLTVSYGMGQVLSSGRQWIFVVHGLLLAVGCALLSLLLPVRRIPMQGSLLDGLRGLVNQPSYLAFVGMNVLMGVGAAAFINFIALRILALGGTEAQVGLGFALNALFEIPIMFMGARLMRRFSMVQLIVSWAARFRHGLFRRRARHVADGHRVGDAGVGIFAPGFGCRWWPSPMRPHQPTCELRRASHSSARRRLAWAGPSEQF